MKDRVINMKKFIDMNNLTNKEMYKYLLIGYIAVLDDGFYSHDYVYFNGNLFVWNDNRPFNGINGFNDGVWALYYKLDQQETG